LVMKHFDMVEKFLSGLNINKNKELYEFVDNGHLFSYSELSKKSDSASDEEVKRLMAIQHLDPDAKKKLAAMQGGLKVAASPGFDFQAQRAMAMPALQEIVKYINTSK